MTTWEDNYYNDTKLEEDAFTLITIPLLEETPSVVVTLK